MIFSPIMLLTANEKGLERSSLGESILVALFTIAVVFAVLCLICILVNVFSKVMSAITKEDTSAKPAAAPVKEAVVAAEPSKEEEFSSGSLKLKSCDEKTAAMIMAIISDNTGIPLSELIFKSITLVDEKK